MQAGYFNSAWHDIKNSPGWFGKVLLLALVGMIPIFGWIVVYGYVYGWARDMAWGVHAPLPGSVFGNEDGKLYRRGFFVLVIGIVCSLIPLIVDFAGSIVTGIGAGSFSWFDRGGYLAFSLGISSGLVGLAFFVVSVAAYFFATFFAWVGSMRMSIYGRLSAGFQFGKMWAMIRHDFGGILRIFGMSILLVAAFSAVAFVLVMVVILAGAMVGIVATGGGLGVYAGYLDGMATGMALVVASLVLAATLLGYYVALAASVFVEMMTARALGYWTRQFDVPAWRGQDDPMPFELAGPAGGGRPPHQQPPMQP